MKAPQTHNDAPGKPEGSDYMGDRTHLRGSAAQALEKFKHYPEAIREDGLWLHFFTRQDCNNDYRILAKIARTLGLKDRSGKEPSDQYWYQVSGGHYFKSGAGDAKAFKGYVTSLRAYAQRRKERGVIPFVETRNWRLVHDYIESRRSPHSSFRMGAIEGHTGSQKTYCGKHYSTLYNHRETIHLEAPARATRARLVQKWAEAYLIAESKNIGGKEIEIERFLKSVSILDTDPNSGRPRAVLLDNVQRLFRPNIPPDQQPIFNYFHELQDDIGFTLILFWVPSFRKTVTASDPFWAQFLGRIGGEDEILRLEQALPKADLLKFARAFQVADDAAAYPYLKRWSQTIWGIRIFMHKLETARRLATARGSTTIEVAHLAEVDLEAVNPSQEEES